MSVSLSLLATVAGADCLESAVRERALLAGTQFANSIACDVEANPKYLVALHRWDNCSIETRDSALFVLLWHGDVGCNGGSGSYSPQVTTIRIGAGDTFFADPVLSTPVVKFPVPTHYVERVVSHGDRHLVLEFTHWHRSWLSSAERDEPDVATLELQNDGNWRLKK
ncbi:hypothetical protein [Niveibacterium microcysteis]|uniref:Tyrosinase copper-binding domain-containing protein n=1 Tax=Niveibacterium microcysteis TaxID=2811415 RepID=A0ABX7M8Y6_9RHOO|nr:hypothetical protein [Niveibacterium microcysteis]QSI78195.1 hypothetical protein JY500_06040 [Niveibacterium microcysteis]